MSVCVWGMVALLYLYQCQQWLDLNPSTWDQELLVLPLSQDFFMKIETN